MNKEHKYHIKIAGAVKHFGLMIELMNDLSKFKDKIDFSFYDGPNLCPWNGGRINEEIFLTPSKVKYFNDKGYGVFLTFSNPIIDLNDEIGNELLEMLNHNELNGVIIINEELRNYVKEKYPEYQIIFSISGHPNSVIPTKELLDYYKDLEDKYDVIVPRFEMGLNEKFFSEVKIPKYELIVNDKCIYNCNIFREHLFTMAEFNRKYKSPWKEQPFDVCNKAHECWIKNFNPDEGSEKDRNKHGISLGMSFTGEMYDKAISLGYTRFKIMGRELTKDKLKHDILKHVNDIYSAIRRFENG
jgi:hypothetical protein